MNQSDKFSRRSWWRGPRPVKRLGREEGSSLYEFALALPVLGMLLVGIIFGGMTFFNYVELANAVEAGGRALANGRGQGTSACSLATGAITNSAGNLNASQVVTGTVQFAGTSSCDSTLQLGDAGYVSAVYPCNLPIPFTNINLCPMASGGSLTMTYSDTQYTLVSCPYSHCISATTTVYIE